MKAITKLTYRDRTFLIVSYERYYMAIEEKYIDENGKTNKALNGLELHVDDTILGCKNKAKMSVEYDYQLQMLGDEEAAMNKAISEVYR
jgi:hypothetical protein